MAELLLHHYDASPFSEKVRLVLGRKRLAWRSVLQPHMMPKPHFLPLTGGYRRIPVLQIGADVYCDSQLIVRILEELHPEPSVYPGGSEGICHALNLWADRLLFQSAVPVVFERLAPVVPKEFMEDRRKLMGGERDLEEYVRAAPLFAEQLRAHLDLLDVQLRDGRDFLLGGEPSLADFAAYHPVWFLRSVGPVARILDGFARVGPWSARVASVGHGAREECAAEEALEIARCATPRAAPGVDPTEPQGLAAGTRVRVMPDDYGFDPVEGELVASSLQEIALRRFASEVGEVVVHFPRVGFRVTPG